MFKDIVKLGSWRAPLTPSELSLLTMGSFVADTDDDLRHARWRRRLYLRAKVAGVSLPSKSDIDPSVTGEFERNDAFEELCEQALVDYYVAHRDRLKNGDDKSAMTVFFDTLSLRSIEQLAKQRGALD